MLTLKDYQQRVLHALSAYFKECAATGDADTAFYSTTKKTIGAGIPYNPVDVLPGLPYVCLRIPTGGGKTFVACHAVGIAGRDLLHADSVVVLWLVPSNPIREQTLERLKDREDPYRQALEAGGGPVNILDIEEALYVKRADLDGGTTIIVSTMQAFRREDTVGLRVHRDSGALMDHFDALPAEALASAEKYPNGQPVRSLANVLCIRRPVVIVDEAHNARTELSFETLARFNPSCIIEFTATPDLERSPSNVVHTVSAAELKAEAMIKMPIHLETRMDWKELLSDAIVCLNNLARIASLEQQHTRERIRPIMLIQAQPHRKGEETLSVEQVKECLLRDHGIPELEIGIATGSKDEISGVDVLSPECYVRYIITMQKLREGWDCPFAYVLCSVADVKSATSVEQLLGRVMRLPNARWKQHEQLNMAYAFTASPHFYSAANALTDALVQSGFERQEAKELIVQSPDSEQSTLPFESESFMGVVIVSMPIPPEVGALSKPTAEKISYDNGTKKFTFQGVMSKAERTELKAACVRDESRDIIDLAYRLSNGLTPNDHGTVSERGEVLSIPVLAIKQGSLFEQFEETHFLDHPWDVTKCDALLSEREYSFERPAAQHGEIDTTDDGRIQATFISSLQEQMVLFASDTNWSVADLVYWLDRSIPHSDLSATETGVFFTRVVQTLIDQRGLSIERLCHDKYRLKDAVAAKLNRHRESARSSAYQTLLAPDCETPLVVTPNVCFSYDPRQYPYSRPYRGRYEFDKHYYPEVGDLGATGEEFECAQYIDQLDEVEFWVRNLERRPRHSFWLQTSTDKFYPDFVCKLKDGRYMVVEYKGAHLADTADTEEKRALGELWAKRSEGRCLFAVPTAKDWSIIEAALHR